jgi:hypothetical protein
MGRGAPRGHALDAAHARLKGRLPAAVQNVARTSASRACRAPTS